MKILAMLFALAMPLSALNYPSGDPTIVIASPSGAVATPGELIIYGPNTPMNGHPIRLERDPGGTTVAMWFCYYDPVPSCTTPGECPTCSDYEPGKTIPLKEWCRRLELLPMPSPALPTDKRPVCLLEWK